MHGDHALGRRAPLYRRAAWQANTEFRAPPSHFGIAAAVFCGLRLLLELPHGRCCLPLAPDPGPVKASQASHVRPVLRATRISNASTDRLRRH
ncbi:hypothetical protein MB84_00595 [Pandoraea oxalativorans]|uniref:Uncharacterized protein n=1 Tax=Pandoraea oxalativorans TaxID=573737 RepID=A0A0E3Y9K2_9BURK|nr:hypothetical protein MB84_00595 [Pandoraea oxalativorans]